MHNVYSMRQLTFVFNVFAGYSSKPMSEWSVSDVSQWLKSIPVREEVVELFALENMDGCEIVDITSEELKSGMPDLPLGIRRKVIRKRKEELDRQKRVNQHGNTDSSPISRSTFPTTRSGSVTERRPSDDKRQLREQVSVNGDKSMQSSDQRMIELENCRTFECAGDGEKPYNRYDILPYTE